MNNDSKIYIAGHTGMVGSALFQRMKSFGFANLLTATRSKLDLLNKTDTGNFLKKNNPDLVILVAAKVGGILANTKYPTDFLYLRNFKQVSVLEYYNLAQLGAIHR
mgnify:CR=1 FL=1